MKRYDGWNLHRFASDWQCRNCGRMRYSEAPAWYRGIVDGPYCTRCMDVCVWTETIHETEQKKVLTENP